MTYAAAPLEGMTGREDPNSYWQVSLEEQDVMIDELQRTSEG